MELDETVCTCRICREVSLDEMHLALSEEASYRRTSTGKYKSEYYAAIALHNFEMEAGLLSRMKEAIESGDSLEELVRHAQVGRGIGKAVGWLLENDEIFASRMAKTAFEVTDSRSKAATPIERNPYQLELFSGSLMAEGNGEEFASQSRLIIHLIPFPFPMIMLPLRTKTYCWLFRVQGKNRIHCRAHTPLSIPNFRLPSVKREPTSTELHFRDFTAPCRRNLNLKKLSSDTTFSCLREILHRYSSVQIGSAPIWKSTPITTS